MIQPTTPRISFIKKKSLVFVFICTLIAFANTTSPFFCHSNCISYIGSCFDVTPQSCYVCDTDIFKEKDFTNPLNPCVPKDQRAILFKELDSSTALTLNGFSTSNSNIFTCGPMSFAGQYVSTDYLQKNFTSITKEHFELIIKFNVAYIGAWTSTDQLQLQITDGATSRFYNWSYNCGADSNGVDFTINSQNLCSIQGTDCVKIKQFNIQHNSSYVFLKWSALTTQTDPNVQHWGIKDITIAAKTCHRYCDKCFGEGVSQCLTCSPGFFLRGNTCVEKCPRLSILQTNECADSCPTKFFHNTLNDVCEKCLDGCSLCSGQKHCLLWQNQSISPLENLFMDKLELWIIIILAGVGLIVFAIWKLVFRNYFRKDEILTNSSGQFTPKQGKQQKEKNENTEKKEQTNEFCLPRISSQNLANQLWIIDSESIDTIKVDVRKRKKRKANIDLEMNNSDIQF